MKKIIIFFISLVYTFGAFANNFKPIKTVTGDINKDNIQDIIVISQDNSHDKAPYKVEIFLKDKNGKQTLIASSTTVIPPQYLDGKNGYTYGNAFNDLEISKGIIIISNDLLRGSTTQKYRFQKNTIELIGYTSTESDGKGIINTIDYNLSTGVKIVEVYDYEKDKVKSKKTIKSKLKTLPNFNTFDILQVDF